MKIRLHDILVGNAKQVNNNFSKPYFFIDTLVTCNIPQEPNLIYLIICLIKLQEVVVFLSKTHSFMVFRLVQNVLTNIVNA